MLHVLLLSGLSRIQDKCPTVKYLSFSSQEEDEISKVMESPSLQNSFYRVFYLFTTLAKMRISATES